ncbi:MAG: hypothetical protein M3141_03385 [Actinomycetota bacterium]|nr:hypothetical protein [Actinomycetota bacterium]
MSFLIAFAFALALTPLAAWVGHATGLVDRPGDPLKIHGTAIPVLGGVAVVGAALAALAIVGEAPPASAVAAAGLLLVGGVVDDVRPLPPAALLLLQAAAGGVLVFAFELEPLTALGVCVLALACTNAVNIVDGQDGLAGGLAAIAAVALAVLLDAAPAALGLALAGALGAFLLWNRPPARIFLGNGGAYAVGALLAVLAATVVEEQGARGIALAALCLGVFLFDLAFTVLRRAGSGALAAGDRLHSYDLLSMALGGRGRSTLVFWGLGALAGALALWVDTMPSGAAAATTAAAAGAAAVGGYRLWSRRPSSSP